MISAAITPPKTYSEWVDVLNKLKTMEDDEAVLSAMQRGTLEWQIGVAERFSKKLIDVINYRMNAASDKFQKEIKRSNGQERVIVQALLAFRKELRFLSEAISLHAIPEKDRQHYCQLIIDHANNVQRSLEDSARKDRSGKLASILKNNRVNAF